MKISSHQEADTPTRPRVSVVMPVFNPGPDLENCLNAIDASTYPVFECILVDDESTDGMITVAAQRHGIQVVTLKENSGPGIARNHGAREARGDILLFVDSDVMLHPDAVAIAVNALENDPGLSAVFGSYDDQPGHTSFLSQYRNLLHHWVHQTGNNEASTFWAGCGAIWRKTFIDIGGFSKDYGRPSIEDIELGTRLRSAGYRIRLEKRMFAKHMKNWRFWNLIKTDIFHRGVPWMGLLLRERHMTRDLNLNINSRIATILASLLGLSLLILPITHNAAAVLPPTAFLLSAAASIWFSGKSRLNTLLALTLVVLAPIVAYTFAPNLLAAIPMALILALILTQQAFFRYLGEKRGGAFAIAVIPMQVLFFCGCALAVMVGLAKHYFGADRRRLAVS
jgi:glycosyltransferase involved in cell wall biosynthesis